MIAELLNLSQIGVPLVDELVGQEEVASRGERRVDERVEPYLRFGRHEVELFVVDQVAVVVGIEQTTGVLVLHAEHEEDLRVGEIATLVVGVRHVAIFELELEVLEHVLALEELVTPIGGRLELGMMEHDEHAAHAQAQEQQEKEHTRFHNQLGQFFAHNEVVEQTGRDDHVVEELLEPCGHVGVYFAFVRLDVLFVRDHERGHHGDDHAEIDQYAYASENAFKNTHNKTFFFYFFCHFETRKILF